MPRELVSTHGKRCRGCSWRCWAMLACIAALAPDCLHQLPAGSRLVALAADGGVRRSLISKSTLAAAIGASELRGALAALDPRPVVAAHSPAASGSRGALRIPREEWHRRRKALLESRCPVNCTHHGTCNEELGRCDCPRHRDGPHCGEVVSEVELQKRCKMQGYDTVRECLNRDQACVNGCNHRGACVAGFCHCAPGYYGSDCALSLPGGPGSKPVLLAGTGYHPREKRPWVYVYELPPKLAVWCNFRRLDRGLHVYVWQRLLGSGARVADGDIADYYFIPVRQRSFGESWLVQESIEYIRDTYPWWNRTGGNRHFIIHTGDWGLGEVSEDVRQMGWNMSWLTHWGLSADRPEIKRWNMAFRPEKDVVIPVYISPGHFVQFGVTRSPLQPTAKQRPRNASTLFFAGRICHNAKFPSPSTFPECGDDTVEWYGGGIREKFFVSHWNRTGFHVVRSEPRYGYYMSRSAYCLAPPGAGHGQRQIQALFMGCVPVTVSDFVAEPFEPALSWKDWGVRVAEADIPRAHEILAAISPEEYARKQSRMHCAAQHMLYSTITGAVIGEDGRFDAFETMLEVLRVRAAHPDAPQEDFRRLDPDFDAFMDCKPPPGFKWINATVPRRTPAKPKLKPEGTAADVAAGNASVAAGGGGVSGSGSAAAAAVAAAGAGTGTGTGFDVAGSGVRSSEGEGAEWGGGTGASGEVDAVGAEEGGDGDGEGVGEGEQGDSGDGRSISSDSGGDDAAATPAPAPALGGAGGPMGPSAADATNATAHLPHVPALCSHAARDMRNRERSCYHFLRGGGYMGVPGGAMCAKGFKTRLAQCPRLWG